MVIGKKTMFIRTAGCDYSCSWCDSAFTWDGSAKDDIVQMSPEDIWEKLQALGGNRFSHVTVSGGNPALLKNLAGVIALLKKNNIEVALETQGSRWQDWFLEIDDLTISPKPPSSGMITDYNKLDDIIRRLKENSRLPHTSLKVVIFNDADLAYAKNIAVRYPEVPLYLQTGNDDTASEDTADLAAVLLEKYEALIDKVAADPALNDVRVLPQLHTLVWGNKRGV
ncbi:7-carboxy-7-deazaguanine synthase QueE [Evansella sp. LMS18]|nr:7-carboxy-7-deazaguanine synthase QueE [Evansella sp. LMS18]